LLTALLFVFSLVYFALYDFLYWEVDGKSIGSALIFGFSLNLINFFAPIGYLQAGWSNLAAAFLLGAIIYIVYALTKGGGMDKGDIFLFVYCGLFLGLIFSFWFYLLLMLSGSLAGVLKIILLRKTAGVKIQFAPFIGFAAIFVFIFREQILLLVAGILG
jgi:prepilin signal peptidase PulO-like enzyme (type II secretory pathway)